MGFLNMSETFTEMANYLYNLAPMLPDAVILVTCGAAFSLLGFVISRVSYIVWFRHWETHTDHEDKIADTVHTSLLGVIAFFLALVTTSEFGSFNKADHVVTMESLQIVRIDRELEALGEVGESGRKILAAYVRDVAADEWPLLGRRPQSLSPVVDRDLRDLWREVRAVQRHLGSEMQNLRDDLSSFMQNLEEMRRGRLSASISNVPHVFWIMMLAFFVGASALSGRNVIRAHGMQINMLYMCAFGLIVGLNVIIDNPFDGETFVRPEKLLRAIVSYPP